MIAVLDCRQQGGRVCVQELRQDVQAPVEPVLPQAGVRKGGDAAVRLLPVPSQAEPQPQASHHDATLGQARQNVIIV